MGEYADLILDGIVCQFCFQEMLADGEEPPGSPQTCKECQEDE